MKFIFSILIPIVILSSCWAQVETNKTPIDSQKIESNTVDIGNKTITTITGSYVQPIR